MKKVLTLALAAVFSTMANCLFGAFTITQGSVSVNIGGTSSTYTSVSNPFNGAYLGRLDNTSSAIITGGAVNITVSGSSQACSGTLFYRVYLQGTTPGAFQSSAFGTFTNVSATSKIWSSTTVNANLLSGITTPGVYFVEVYWTATGHATTSACTTTFTENNSGAFFRASFEYAIIDSYSDGNFSSSPVWSGDTGSFTTVATSDVTSTSATNSNTIRLSASGAGTQHMSTPITMWNQEQSWAFWVGRRAQAYSNNNYALIWLFANESNLESATVDGYRLRIGDNSGVDEITLESVTNGTGTTILTSTGGISNNTTDTGIALRITRNASGTWTLFTSAFPTANGSGVNAHTNPYTSASTNRGSVTNTTYTPSGNGFFGFTVVNAGSANARAAFEFDNFYFGSLPTMTCPGNQTLTLNGSCSTTLPDYRSMVTLSNNCNCFGTLTMTQSPAPGTAYSGAGTTAVTITLTSSFGPSSSCSFNVTRADQTPPVLTCPSNITVNAASGLCGAFVNYTTPTMTDNCSNCAPSSIAGYTLIGTYNGHTYFRSSASVTWLQANTAATALGGHLVTFSDATEAAYFNALGQHWIGFTDRNTEGVWEWVTGEGVTYTNWNAGEPNDANNEDYCVINWTGNTWNDWNDASTAPFIVEFDCVTLTAGLPSGSLFPIGTTTVTYMGTDGAGNNSAPCSFTVTVNDNSAPVISCPSNITVTASANACSAVVNYNTPVAVDNCSNCSSVIAKSGFTSLGIFNGKSYYISNTAADLNTALLACSNAGGTMATIASASENGFIRGAANALGIGNYLIGLNDATVEGTFAWPSGLPVTYTNWNSGEPNNYGTGEDFVEVLPNGLWNDISGTGRYILEVQCHNVVRTAGPASGSSFPIGTSTVTHSVTDASGNSSNCSFNITVNPNITPTITCPVAQSLTLGISGSASLPDYRSLVVVNSPCYSFTVADITQNPAPGTNVNAPGFVPVSMSYTNPLGTTVNCSFNVNVVATTIVYISGSGATYNENAGSFSIPVAIVNPSGSAATSVQLAITSGVNTRINNYNTQTITFPAGSSTTQNINVVLSNNTLCDGSENITFSLQNISGGNSATLNGNTSFALAINDDDLQSKNWLTENAESGSISSWTQNTTNNWTASNVAPCSGVYSIRHNVSGVAGESWISKSLDKRIMTGVTTTWGFNLNHYFTDPSDNDKFLYFLSSSTSSLSNVQQNGYAIGVNPSSASDPDLIKLFRITNGVIDAEVISTSFDIDATHGEIGFVITRNESGVWSIQIDATGDFDNLISQGTATDNTYDELSFTGLKYTYTAATAGKLSVDDIQIMSSGCPCTWYSVQSGNSSAPIWSQTIAGTAQTAKFSEYDNFSVQPTHAISLNNKFVAANLTVSNNSTLDAGNQDIILFGNLTNNGSVVAGSGTLHFKGATKQTVTSANDLTMSFINIDNDNDSVKYTGPGELIIADNLQIDQGDFHSGNKTTLKSTSSKTAAIGTISDNGSFAGKVTLQRSIPSLGNGIYGSYVAFGSPLTGQTLNDWNDDIITTGFPGSDFPPPYSFNNIYYYNESATGSMNNGYVPATSINDPIQTNRGYFVYLQSPVQQVDVTGEIQQHAFDAPLSYTDSSNPTDDGWNLMVNQYPSEVDFKKLAQNGSGVASYSIYDSESNNFKSYNANLNLGTASRFVPSSQSFFVKASSAGAYLHYDETYKTSQGVAFERDGETEEVEESTANIVMQISASNGSSDLSILAFSNNATQAYDVTADVLKMNSSSNTAVEMAIPATSGQMLSINCMPFMATQIPVFIELPVAGTYTFTVNSITNVDIHSCIKIQDVLTGNMIPVEPGQILSLQTGAPYSGNRLVIHVAPAPQFEVTDTSCADIEDGELAFITNSETPVTIVSASGNTVYSGNATGVVGELAGGQYTMITSYENNVCPSVETPFEILSGSQITMSIAELQYDVCNESGNGAVEIHISGASDYAYEIFDATGNSVYMGESTGGIITAAELTHQVYTVVVSTECGPQSIQADVSDPMAVTTNISNAETTFDITDENNHYVIFEQSSVNADTWNWSLDNGVTSTESSFGYSFDEPGNHTLMLIASNGTCSAVDFIQVNVSEVLSVNETSENPYITTTQNQEQITFIAHQIAGSTLMFNVYDASGKLVHSSKQNAVDGSQLVYGYDGVAGGIYSAVISCENKPLLSHKFFVEKH